MAVPLRLPDVGTVEGAVTVVRWLRAVGEPVAAGEPLLEVETDKGVIAVEAAASGTLLATLVAEGQSIQTDDPIAWVGAAGEKPPTAVAPAVPPAPAPPPAGGATGAATPAAAGKVSPVVRKLAQEKGVDLATVSGTGAGGMVTREDVLRRAGAPAPAATLAHGRPLSLRQAVIARKVSQSHREKPTIHLTAVVDMSRAVAARSGQGTRYDSIFLKAAGTAIRDFPVFRAYLKGEEVVEHAAVDVALAVAVADDLYAPAIRGADAKPLPEISREIEGFAQKARAHALSPSEMEGSCFLVSNLGALPVESFDAVIYPEHSAALAVGAIAPVAVADAEGRVSVVPQLRMTLSVDHRLINGRTAAEFLVRIKQTIEGGSFA